MEELGLSKLEILKDKLEIATLEYLEELQKTVHEKYAKEIEGKIIDKNNIMYKYYFNEEISSARKDISADTMKFYKKLVLRVHPDKTSDENAQAAFIKLEEYKDTNNIDALQYFHDNIESEDLLEIILNYKIETGERKTVIQKINEIKNSYWYIYHTDSIFRSLFVDPKK